ncbi:MAG TPA: lipase family protein [Chitinophagales bacterium]|nr:lipase family protein [Chitinophagales bacterium]HMX61357.1 lipase family protein [Chitinophagales bacterium]HMY24274.1 lipase family protein [Chitinophagales bacterium]HNA38074.1 lipase family protein [Chitinophagales bacterium]HND84050.1 lipase family protein [Chitinophagales bacterium]
MKWLVCIIIGVFGIIACKENNINTSAPDAYLGNTYISHRYKDRLSAVQLIDRLSAVYPNADSLIRAQYDVTVYRIFYKTHNFQNQEISASGLVYIPEIRHYFAPVVCFQHGTCIQKQEVPSIAANLSYYVPFIIASETGAIVCAADYIGLGFSDGKHHFYEPTEEANAVVDMLGSVQPLLNKTYQKITFDDSVLLFGYSQGGHATLAAQRLLETKYDAHFHIQASAPMASWFSFENSSQLNVLKAALPFDFPSAYAYLINSIQSTQSVFSSYNEMLQSPYDSLCSVLFDGTKSTGYVNSKFPATFHAALQTSFVNELNSNPDNNFITALKKYDIINDWIPKSSTRFYHSQGDEIAFYDNSEIAYNTFKNKGGNVHLINLGNYNHFEANIIAIDSVRNWFYPLIKIKPY